MQWTHKQFSFQTDWSIFCGMSAIQSLFILFVWKTQVENMHDKHEWNRGFDLIQRNRIVCSEPPAKLEALAGTTCCTNVVWSVHKTATSLEDINDSPAEKEKMLFTPTIDCRFSDSERARTDSEQEKTVSGCVSQMTASIWADNARFVLCFLNHFSVCSEGGEARRAKKIAVTILQKSLFLTLTLITLVCTL